VPNRLATETSPYLLQHAENPVDWFPWGDEAFELARKTDRPVFLSVGYSSCHWCHVMAHESFEDPEVGRQLNKDFVCIKVDREERPDVDEAYMTAVQLMTGRGGWPMSVFMTSDRRPFLTGTYWPKEDRGGHMGFVGVLQQVTSAWNTKRALVEESAQKISEALTEALGTKPPESTGSLDFKLVDQAVQALLSDFDQKNGGFGAAPKFPPHTGIEFLLRYATSPSTEIELQEAALSAALLTLRSIVLGGIHDHVGGGFHRYSTDEKWLLPHFEKMLYDNALMLGNLAMAVGVCAELEPSLAEIFARAAQRLVDWLMREMTSEEGFFFSALDADSEGEEGKYYVWSVDEVTRILQHHAPVFLDSFCFELGGNFEDEATRQKTGANILHLKEDLGGQFEQELEMLRLEREERVHPGLDDKGLVGWNGLMIGSLADAALWPLAQNAVVAIISAEKQFGKLPHQISKGVPSGDAYLEDYAYFVHGVIKLAICHGFMEEQGELPPQAIPADTLFNLAKRLCDEMVAKFYDPVGGGFFATSKEHEQLFGRTKPIFDQPTPSANGIAIRCLIQLGEEEKAAQSLQSLLGWMQRAPQATEALYTTSLMLLSPPVESDLEALPIETELPAIAAVVEPKVTTQVVVKISGREFEASGEGIGAGTISLVIPEGVHLNSSKPPARWLTPTKLEIKGVQSTITYPEPTEDRYVGAIEIPFTVVLPRGQSGAEFELVVRYQACTDTECRAPEEKVFSAAVVR